MTTSSNATMPVTSRGKLLQSFCSQEVEDFSLIMGLRSHKKIQALKTLASLASEARGYGGGSNTDITSAIMVS